MMIQWLKFETIAVFNHLSMISGSDHDLGTNLDHKMKQPGD